MFFPFLRAHTHLLVFLAETEQESMAKQCGVLASIDLLGTDAMTMNRKVFLARGDTYACLMNLVIIRATVLLRHIYDHNVCTS